MIAEQPKQVSDGCMQRDIPGCDQKHMQQRNAEADQKVASRDPGNGKMWSGSVALQRHPCNDSHVALYRLCFLLYRLLPAVTVESV